MRLVIVSYDFPPSTNNWGGSQRMFHLAECAVRRGMDVEVVSLSKYHTGSVKMPDSSAKLYSYESKGILLRSLLKRKGSAISANSKPRLVPALLSRFLYGIAVRIDRCFFNEPGLFAGTIGYLWRRELRVDRRFLQLINDADTIVISAPPFSLFGLAKDFSKFNCQIIFDYRDPWNLWKQGNLVTSLFERSLLKLASNVVTTTEPVAVDLCEIFGLDPSCCVTLPNGADSILFDCKPSVASKSCRAVPVLCYFGAITLDERQVGGFRDFSVLFDLLSSKQFDFIFRIVGVTNPNSHFVQCLKERFGTSIEIVPELPLSVAFEHLKSSDLCFLPHLVNDGSGKYIISGKFYDYLLSGLPILSVGPIESLHSQKIMELGVGVHCGNDLPSLVGALRNLVSGYIDYSAVVRSLDHAEFGRDGVNERYLYLLEKRNDKR